MTCNTWSLGHNFGEGVCERINVCPLPCKVRKLNLAMQSLETIIIKKLLHYKFVSSTFQTHGG